MPIKLISNDPIERRFHNQTVSVYWGNAHINDIKFWPQNARTVFSFERLIKKHKVQDIEQIPIETIVRELVKENVHKISTLAASIRDNGVQVPLILTDDGDLLDGNRRFFALYKLKMDFEDKGEQLPTTLKKIPVQIIRREDLDEFLEIKILAEANFIPSLKIPWPLDAKARTLSDYINKLSKTLKLSADEALANAAEAFGLEKQYVQDLIETQHITNSFIQGTKIPQEKESRREVVQNKFVYFWEFRNKAMKGRGALDKEEYGEVEELFFLLMSKKLSNPIKNVKMVEPFVQSRRDEHAWDLLTEDPLSNFPIVVNHVNEKKTVRKSEDKIRLFYRWLENEKEFSPGGIKWLEALTHLAAEKVQNA